MDPIIHTELMQARAADLHRIVTMLEARGLRPARGDARWRQAASLQQQDTS